MNKKFLAIFVLLSVIPGCWWGPRYQCVRPCGEPRTTCVEAKTTCVEATDCYQEAPQAPLTTCYEDTGAVSGNEYCYEDNTPAATENVEYCYEADDYPEFDTAKEYSTENYFADDYSYPEETESHDFEDFDYDAEFGA